MAINCEQLGYWYLRLNGFLTTANFVIHPRAGSEQGTDIDVMGVRFPHRRELVLNPLADAEVFASDCPQFVFAEVKSGRCALNGPWTRPERENMQNALAAIGAVPEAQSEEAATFLYTHGEARVCGLWFRLICLGAERDVELAARYPVVPQILWNEVEGFIFDRFRENQRRKVAHAQWDDVGKALWDAATRARDLAEFRGRIPGL
jgi:hypothetical protein